VSGRWSGKWELLGNVAIWTKKSEFGCFKGRRGIPLLCKGNGIIGQKVENRGNLRIWALLGHHSSYKSEDLAIAELWARGYGLACWESGVSWAELGSSEGSFSSGRGENRGFAGDRGKKVENRGNLGPCHSSGF